jgi:hypothetical protein
MTALKQQCCHVKKKKQIVVTAMFPKCPKLAAHIGPTRVHQAELVTESGQQHSGQTATKLT